MGILNILSSPSMLVSRREMEWELNNWDNNQQITEHTADMYSFVLGEGMRFRPLLVYLGNYLVGGTGRGLAPLAAAVELLHKASLVHDDLIDGDDLRRGRFTFHRRYGKREAVLMGDFLIGSAFMKTAALREHYAAEICLQVQDVLAELVFSLGHGVLREIQREGNYSDREEILRVMYEKTAIFLEKCLFLGGLLGGAEKREQQALAGLGKNLGMVFQIINDFNNVRPGEGLHRGRAGRDLEQQKATLLSNYLWGESNDRGEKICPEDDNQLFFAARTFFQPLLEECTRNLESLKDSFWKRELQDLEGCVMELWNWGKGLTGGSKTAFLLPMSRCQIG